MIEVRIPCSPTPAMLNRVRLIAASVRQWGSHVKMRVSCYPPCDTLPAVTERTGKMLDFSFDRIQWSSPTDADFAPWSGTRAPFMSTILDSFRPPFAADWVLHLDCDVVPVARFDELFRWDAIQGVQAHVPPIDTHAWSSLFRSYGLPPITRWHAYSGAGAMPIPETNTCGPFYPNSGMLFGPVHLFERLWPAYAEAITYLRVVMSDHYWIDQIGLTLAFAAAEIPTRALPLRYNHPNRPRFDEAHPEELADIRFVHAMEVGPVDRDRDFASSEALDALCARTDLTGSNEVLRKHIAEIRGVAGL